ncbi:MAG TPA: hypothetical protein ACFYD8_13210 [Candidatus Wujingus californicus]|uniref:hypothetical protein n=1 Tax=Candidatus Wujingus californicus TaxID=3367618 RepID=UPI0040259251
MKTITFNDALEIVESLPEGQRESLIEIVKNRLIEERRDRLAQNIKEAREEYARGDIRKGTVDDLMRETSR